MSRPLDVRALPAYVHRGCRKRAYPSRADAEKALTGIGKRTRRRAGRRTGRRRPTVPRRAYKCPDCGQWHLTSSLNRSPAT